MIAAGALYARYLFKHPNLCRPFYWDCKNAIREIAAGTNTFLPNIAFSHRDSVACSVRGAARYFFLRKQPAPNLNHLTPAEFAERDRTSSELP